MGFMKEGVVVAGLALSSTLTRFAWFDDAPTTAPELFAPTEPFRKPPPALPEPAPPALLSCKFRGRSFFPSLTRGTASTTVPGLTEGRGRFTPPPPPVVLLVDEAGPTLRCTEALLLLAPPPLFPPVCFGAVATAVLAALGFKVFAPFVSDPSRELPLPLLPIRALP